MKNNELITYQQRVKIGWLIVVIIIFTIALTLGVFVNFFLDIDGSLHAFIFIMSLIIGGAGVGISINGIFDRILKIEDCFKETSDKEEKKNVHEFDGM